MQINYKLTISPSETHFSTTSNQRRILLSKNSVNSISQALGADRRVMEFTTTATVSHVEAQRRNWP